MFWAVAGEKSFRMRGYGTIASSKFLSLAFKELGLHVISTWAVENNPSLRGIRRLGFRFIGRQRQCHYMDGGLYDRLLFDLLASEHRELDEARWHRNERSQREPIYAERSAQPG
jgi:RimJ/RimL family protein N-acetyltransferase